MKPDELVHMLETFGIVGFAKAVSKAKLLVQQNEASITRRGSPVQAGKLRDIYAARATSPNTPSRLSPQCEQLAQVAAQFPHERWYLHTIGDKDQVAIFSNEDGVGRACLDFEDR